MNDQATIDRSDARQAGVDRTRICLAGSGGGHVRQLFDLTALYEDEDHFFVTEDTALGRSVAAKSRAHFVAHVALGQARLGAPIHMLMAAFRNAAQSLKIIRKERPSLVITTGAGSMFFVTLFARLMGSRIILIDSFARFSGPSAFARIARPLAHMRVAQSRISAENWPGAIAFDPLRELEREQQPKEPLLFATVGATLRFDRLVEMVADAKQRGLISEDVIFQTGDGGPLPQGDGIEAHEALPFDQVGSILRRASIVVCHAGTGSIITALREGCKVIVVPRRFALGEHYDDHQSEITTAFVERGLVSMANNAEELAVALKEARQRPQRFVTTDHQPLIAHLADDLARHRAIKPH